MRCTFPCASRFSRTVVVTPFTVVVDTLSLVHPPPEELPRPELVMEYERVPEPEPVPSADGSASMLLPIPPNRPPNAPKGSCRPPKPLKGSARPLGPRSRSCGTPKKASKSSKGSVKVKPRVRRLKKGSLAKGSGKKEPPRGPKGPSRVPKGLPPKKPAPEKKGSSKGSRVPRREREEDEGPLGSAVGGGKTPNWS